MVSRDAEVDALKAKLAELEGKLAEKTTAEQQDAPIEEVEESEQSSWRLTLCGIALTLALYFRFIVGPASSEVIVVHLIALNEAHFDNADVIDKTALNRAKMNEAYVKSIYSLGGTTVLAKPLASRLKCDHSFVHSISRTSFAQKVDQSCSESPWNLIMVTRHRSGWHFTSAWEQYNMQTLDLPEIINSSFTFVSTPRSSMEIATESFCGTFVQPTVRGVSRAMQLIGGYRNITRGTDGNRGGLLAGVPVTAITLHRRPPRFRARDSTWKYLRDLIDVITDQFTVASAGGRPLIRGEKFDTFSLPTRVTDEMHGVPAKWEGYEISQFQRVEEYMQSLQGQDPNQGQACSAETKSQLHILSQPRESWESRGS
jgi:hypothetical protein